MAASVSMKWYKLFWRGRKSKLLLQLLTWLLVVVIFDDYSVRSMNGGSVVGSRQPNILVINPNFKVELIATSYFF
ncbi:hypothetical protein E0H88_15055 [Acinetobacter sp. ANC 4216]|uniref:hypothetical protein n=1 Tax=Acinetobacter sp. ANC 4216 TaxID=2529840 RepID=UPI00103CE97C|nr:hypothetical protein [Acinetobacter sp. ANC 4216]TCB64264.1 hypothetical protein E0H88_15055 [Acinetobacter sp. ANC 4216]